MASSHAVAVLPGEAYYGAAPPKNSHSHSGNGARSPSPQGKGGRQLLSGAAARSPSPGGNRGLGDPRDLERDLQGLLTVRSSHSPPRGLDVGRAASPGGPLSAVVDYLREKGEHSMAAASADRQGASATVWSGVFTDDAPSASVIAHGNGRPGTAASGLSLGSGSGSGSFGGVYGPSNPQSANSQRAAARPRGEAAASASNALPPIDKK